MKKRVKLNRMGKLFFVCLIIGFIGFGLVNKKNIASELPTFYENPIDYDDAYIDETTLVGRLKKLRKEDNRIEEVIAHIEEYPEDLLEMLTRNVDMLDFVLGFPTKKGTVGGNRVTVSEIREVPLFLQYDENFGYALYGDNYLAINGCAPTSLAMVITYLTKRRDVTPVVVSEYAYQQGYYVPGVGTSWSLMTKGSQHFGVRGKEIALSKWVLYTELEKGHPVIASVRPGDFTTIGHFIVLAGIQEGKIKVNDPNSKERSHTLWDYERLEKQIKNLWAFSLQ